MKKFYTVSKTEQKEFESKTDTDTQGFSEEIIMYSIPMLVYQDYESFSFQLDKQ